MKINFITFANTAFMQPTRILDQAKSFPFDEIRSYSELDFPEFFEKHSAFIHFFSKGYGFYIWKPHIIYETLKKMNDGDILLYADAGCHLNAKSKALGRFYQYLSYLENKDIVAFSLNNNYKARYFIKQDAIQFYYPNLNQRDDNYLAASVILIKKSRKSLQMIQDWLYLCEQYSFLDPFPSRYSKESSFYRGNDLDNGLYNLVIFKNEEVCKIIYPDEVNIYNEKGEQLTQLADKENIDWSPLDNFPFQTRRDRPA